jgi:uncharacterized protein YeaO (DUF488 family)
MIRVVRLGTPRARGEGLRLGTVRLLPRGVKKGDFAKRDYFDLWLPEVAPSAELVSWALSQPWTDKRWATFARRYHSEMRKPAAQRLIALLAAVSSTTNFSIGCYCENASRCHRSLLGELLQERGADVFTSFSPAPRRRRTET